MPQVAPYGSWVSPIGIDVVVESGGMSFGWTDATPDGTYWVEARAAEAGRSVLVYAPLGGAPADVFPDDFNVRTRVHEYGGGAWWRHGETIFCSSFENGRIYRLDGRGAEPRPVTPEPPEPNALRYADGSVTQDGRLVICVRETHGSGPEPTNELVVFPADGSAAPRVVARGRDFYAAPRLSPDGTRLAFLAWDHPRTPFDWNELWLAAFAPDGTLSDEQRLAGEEEEVVAQPEWSADGVLHVVSDRSGWSNLYTVRDGALEPLCPTEGEFSFPQWVFGLSTYAFLGDGRIACSVTRRGIANLELLDPETGALESAGLPYTAYFTPGIHACGDRVVFSAGSPTEPLAVVSYDVRTTDRVVLRRSVERALDARYLPVPEEIEFAGEGGETAYAFFYPPRNGDYDGPPAERPPLVVLVHGGPTSQVFALLDTEIAFWTSRGIGVVDVNYGGSTGFGRAYRDRLRHRWGIVDIGDCIGAATFLAENGRVDGARMLIMGGSAGGYTTLLAIAVADVFAAGISEFGVADLVAFRSDTHKFEAHYDAYLVGPFEERLYTERSPVAHADGLSAPLLLLQGLDDKIVPPSQAAVMVEALERKGIPYAYVAFEGEGHGFRRAENRRRAYEAELLFAGRILGFAPADELEPIEIKNLDAARR